MYGISRVLGFLWVASCCARADEGMWLFNKPPEKALREVHGFEIPAGWLEHLQKSSVRFNSGGSGSFVSPKGLILTNHHVGADVLEQLSGPGKDYLEDGFYAAAPGDELRCPELELNVLMGIEDVTERVNGVVSADHTDAEAFAARNAEIAAIEKASSDRTGLRSDVVTLYQGGARHLYQYKRYTDVRLVFAPDRDAAAFGGDPDNFEYPRHCLDLCFFRAYENGQPAETKHFLKWNVAGAAEGDLVFVSGHPGHTSRSSTLAQVRRTRDSHFPYRLERLFRGEVVLGAWAARDIENRRRASGTITGIQNGRKATRGELEGLLDPEFMERKAAGEMAMRRAFEQRAEFMEAAEAFDDIAEAVRRGDDFNLRGGLLEGGDAFGTKLFDTARTLVRAAEETPKPDGERLPEFQSAGRESLEFGLFSPAPWYKDFETVMLANSLTFLCEKLGAEDPLVRKILAGKAPSVRANELIDGTRLDDPAVRKALYAGGREAIEASEDPMIALARLVDGEARALRKRWDELDEVTTRAHGKIARARFALEGDTVYPDATFTLRLAFGIVKGYEENGRSVPFQTTLGGLYERSRQLGGAPPFALPRRWAERKEQVDLQTPFNFVSTADITGGNSGSPVVNRKGELIGLIFDGNLASLVNDFGYTDKAARSVSVHAAGMVEALRKIYGADRVTDELDLTNR